MGISSMLRQSLRQGAKIPEYKTFTPPPDRWDSMAWWEKGLDYLSRGTYASAGFAKAFMRGKNPFVAALRGVQGIDRTTYDDVLKEAGMDKGLARAALGFAGDVFLDPTTYLTFGAGAGARATIGGVSKTLQPAAQAARVAMAAKAAAQFKRVLPALKANKPEVYRKLIQRSGLSMIAKDMSDDLLAKSMGTSIANRGLERAVMGKGLPSKMRGLLPEGAGAKELTKESFLRFMGAPIVPGKVLAMPFKGAGKAWLLAERAPLIGPAMKLSRATGEHIKDAIKTVFSASTGDPRMDEILGMGGNVVGFRQKQIIHVYKQAVIDPLRKLKKQSPGAYEEGLAQVRAFMEGVVEESRRVVNDEDAVATITKNLDGLVKKLNDTSLEISAMTPGTMADDIARALANAEGALPPQELAEKFGKTYRHWTSQASSKALKSGKKFDPSKLPMHGTGGLGSGVNTGKWAGNRLYLALDDKPWSSVSKEVGAGKVVEATTETSKLGTPFFDYATQKWMVKVGGSKTTKLHPVDYTLKADAKILVIDSGEALKRAIKEAGEVAGDVVFPIDDPKFWNSLAKIYDVVEIRNVDKLSDEYKFFMAAGGDQAVVLNMDAVVQGKGTLKGGASSVPTQAKLPVEDIASTADNLSMLQRREKALREAVQKERDALASPPQNTIITKKRVRGPVPTHPAMAKVAQFLVDRMNAVHMAESAHLPLPPDKLEFYLPHYFRSGVKESLIDVIKANPEAVVRPGMSGRLGEALRRSTSGTVDDITLPMLVDSGVLDPSKVKKYLAGKGQKLTADDMLVFEKDPVVASLRREMNSINAMTSAEAASDILNSPYFLKATVKLGDVDAIKMALWQHGPDHALFVPTKTYIQNWKTAAEREALRSGKDKALTQSFIQEITPGELGDLTKAGVEGYILPKEVADHLSKSYKLHFDEDSLKVMFKDWDAVTAWWKTFATVVRPGFHFRNMFSNFWNMSLAGMRGPGALIKSGVILHNAENSAMIGQYTGKQILELVDMYGVRRTGWIGTDSAELIMREAAPNKNPFSTRGPVARAGGALGTSIEDHARVALFIDGIEKGMDPASAAMRTKKYLFDYNDLSKYERGIFKRFIPFYVWTRKNLPLSVETLLTQPGAVASLGKIQDAGGNMVDDPIDSKYVADWIRDGLGVPVKKGAQGTEFFLLKNWIPTADLLRMDVRELASMMHPIPKTALEQLMNYNIFMDRKIEKFSGQKEKLLGITMRGRISHIARNIVVAQELDRLLFKGAEVSEVPGLLIGVKTYSQDKVRQMRSKVYELQDTMGELRGVIGYSKKKYGGDSSIVKQAEVEYMRLTEERDHVKENLLQIDPEAMRTRKKGPEKPRQGPTTLQGLKRSISIDALMRKASSQ